mmetsp:Transcript_6784/g.12088  ORF Transcript_6784/g.12088 Transcript_6784/m.12088 type:complete len:115 (+) Transcript_6784:218-562(+)
MLRPSYHTAKLKRKRRVPKQRLGRGKKKPVGQINKKPDGAKIQPRSVTICNVRSTLIYNAFYSSTNTCIDEVAETTNHDSSIIECWTRKEVRECKDQRKRNLDLAEGDLDQMRD